jgi:hypothetical protein
VPAGVQPFGGTHAHTARSIASIRNSEGFGMSSF